MTIEYNKPKKRKDRIILPRGPRDLQRRQTQEVKSGSDNTKLLENLNEQIQNLQGQLNSGSIDNESLDEKIMVAIKKETAKYKERIVELEGEINILKSNIENKDILIEQLKQVRVDVTSEAVVDLDIPVIEETFIDPIEKELEVVTSHIKNEETIGAGKEVMNDQVAKLKKLLGKV